MKRLRLMGVSAFLVLAFAAVPAMASASGVFFADQYPVALHGLSAGNFKLSVPGTPSCEFGVAPKEIGAQLNGLSTGPVESGSCSGGSSIKLNGCGFEFHPESGTANFAPAGCGPVTATIPSCKYTLTPVMTPFPASYTNTGEGKTAEVQIAISEASLKYSSDFCGNSTTKLSGTWRVFGTSGVAPVGVHTVSTGQSSGAFISREAEGKPGRLDSLIFPVSFTGEQALVGQPGGKEFTVLQAAGQLVRCAGAGFNDTNATSSSLEFSPAFHPSFSGCKYGELSASVTTSPCSYALSNIQGVPLVFTMNAKLECGAKQMEINIANLDGPGKNCLVKVPSQELIGTQEISNEGSSLAATIGVRLSGSKLHFETVGSGVLCSAMGTSGKTYGGFRVSAAYAG